MSRTSSETPAKGFKVCLFGASLDVGNMGCRALAVSLIKLVADARPDAEISLLYANRISYVKKVRLSADRTVQVRVVNRRMTPKSKLQENSFFILFLAFIHRFAPFGALRERICKANAWLGSLKEADFVGDIRGGDSFSDIYSVRGLVFSSIPVLTAVLMGKDLVLLPQTYGPYKTFIARRIARFTMLRASKIYSRDKRGIEVVRDLLGKKAEGKSILLCPDVAFSLPPIAPKSPGIVPALDLKKDETLVGFNVSGLLYMGGYSRDNMFGLKCDYAVLVRRLLSRLLALPGVHVLLTPHTFSEAEESDQNSCRKIWEASPEEHRNRTHLVENPCDQNEIKAVIGGCDFFIGSRMHSCIAAISQGVPCVGLAYSRKFLGVFGSVDMGAMVLDMRKIPGDALLEECMKCFENRREVAASLEKNLVGIQSKQASFFRDEVLAPRSDEREG